MKNEGGYKNGFKDVRILNYRRKALKEMLGRSWKSHTFRDEIHGFPPTERLINIKIIFINYDNGYQIEAISKRETEGIIGKALW
ncbi:MAG: hypothetical protein ACP5R0_04955 [Thermoplasmata archaeon]